MEGNHTEDLWNVIEGDEVTLETSEGEHFDATCVERRVELASERSGEVRETTMWFFDAVEYQPVISITHGLRSSESDPDFPIHNEAWCKQQEGGMGYITSVQIHGPRLES
jgi:hypothetical protein